jgi:DNA (cytosine-5)-methyltransferase 1
MRLVSLFSGIGGFELGFAQAGFETKLMCESDVDARGVLARHFPTSEIRQDIRRMKSLPVCEVVSAGWPCQDLSQAGRTQGITGDKSGLVGEVFRLLHASSKKPEYIVLENVAFALHLQNGQALAMVTHELELLGYNWAYRILDSKHFGLPQRRRRLFIVGSRKRNPGNILFDYENTSAPWPAARSKTGFYWTEGNTGIGWSPGAVPPLKGGSGLSIPSPPAIWRSQTNDFVVPGISDAERMQGFPINWTRKSGMSPKEERSRWRLVGNAVSVPVASWIANRMLTVNPDVEMLLKKPTKRANAGYGGPKSQPQFMWMPESPSDARHTTLDDFEIAFPEPLSHRAAQGFFSRVSKSSLNVDSDFMRDLQNYTL